MFGRRNRESREAADREQSRRALFEELAKRPANICPFLGLASSQTEYHEGFTREHRCYAFGDPVELSAEQQERVCLGRGYGNCPRYLRGVLVIPTDELEALRRPLPQVAPPRPPVAPPPPGRRAQAGGGGRRRGLAVLVGAVMLLAVGGTVGALVLLKGSGIGNEPSASPSPSISAGPSATAPSSEGPSATPEPSNQTPFPETPKPDPTPQPGVDTFQGYEVTVLEGQNTLFEVNHAGDIVRDKVANFSRFSKAPVDRVTADNGLLHWRTSDGFFTGLSYIKGQSGAFLIRAVYESPEGQKRYIVLDEEDI